MALYKSLIEFGTVKKMIRLIKEKKNTQILFN
jgi:hypothetical protein